MLAREVTKHEEMASGTAQENYAQRIETVAITQLGLISRAKCLVNCF